MDELRKAKLDLPPPPQPNELPKKPFGVIEEQNFEAKVKIHQIYFWGMSNFQLKTSTYLKQVGIRKSLFTNSEKEVLQTVILKREQTAQDLAAAAAAEAAAGTTQVTMNGSNGHLNTGNLINNNRFFDTLIFSFVITSCTFVHFVHRMHAFNEF